MSGTVGSVALCRHGSLARSCDWCFEVKELLDALGRCAIRCEHLNHRPGDYHSSGELCPVEAMVNAAMRNAE